jgi:NAD(P)-dependent dehydrogenase (short-subunit alcohol dehydrogenase family)
MELALQYNAIRARYPELSAKVAVVTGSSRNIGKGIALRLGREGMRVVVNGRTAETVEATTAELRSLGVDALAVTADVGDRAAVDRLFDETLCAYGTVDLLVNNAAFMQRRHFVEVDPELFERSLAANIMGPYLCASRAVELMRAGDAPGGSIVHISSVGGFRAHWRGLPYDATKGAIDAMTRAMAIELAEYGIRVNAVAPGATRTDRSPAPDSEAAGRIRQRVPLGRFGTTIEIGNAVAFLASEDAAYVTGQVLYVDGGVTAQLDPRTNRT